MDEVTKKPATSPKSRDSGAAKAARDALAAAAEPLSPAAIDALGAANAAGDRQKASEYYGKLVNLARNADTDRPETGEAKAYLSGTR
jgi:hypothetical protein